MCVRHVIVVWLQTRSHLFRRQPVTIHAHVTNGHFVRHESTFMIFTFTAQKANNVICQLSNRLKPVLVLGQVAGPFIVAPYHRQALYSRS